MGVSKKWNRFPYFRFLSAKMKLEIGQSAKRDRIRERNKDALIKTKNGCYS